MKIISKMMVCVLGAGLMLNFASCIHDAGKEPVMYEVSYVTEYGECPRSFLVEENTVLTAEQLPMMKKEDFFFAGWYDGEVKALSKKYKVTHNVKLTAKWKVPVELKTCDKINSLFEKVAGKLKNPKHFAKSKIKPENPAYFLDVAESEVPLWYDEESRILYYYIEEGKALGLRSKANFNGLFYGLYSIEYIDTSDFDTSKVTSMEGMFSNCSSLKKLNLSNFDTSSVSDMEYMFSICKSLTEVDLSNFDTSNVTSMSHMFRDCLSLEELDLSNFDTSNVTCMSSMFSNCGSLEELDVSSFDTSKVKSMDRMFSSCWALKELDLSNFDTSNVTDMWGMFGACHSMIDINLSSFNTGKVTSMPDMFSSCSSLKELDLSNFDTSNVTSIEGMFWYCESLTKIITSDKFVADKVESLGNMFKNCNALKGGAGTVYNADHVDKEYARIDGGPDKPGYFTAKE